MYQTPTSKTGRSVKPHHLSVLIATATVWAASLHSADAAPPAFEFNAPSQIVMVGETLGVFDARVVICSDNQADGFVNLFLRDGTSLELTPVSAKLHFRAGSDVPTATIVYLPTGLVGAAQPGQFVVGTAVPSPTDPECDLWLFDGSSVQPGPTPGRLQVEARTTRTRIKERCESDDFGQFSSRAELDAQRQTVFPVGGSDPLEFEAMVDIDRDNSASGFVDLLLSPRGGLYEICFGAVLRHAEFGFQFFAVGVLADPGDPLSTDDMVRATATPIPGPGECLIWDLLNGSTGEVNDAATFDAVTKVKVSPRPKGFGFINP